MNPNFDGDRPALSSNKDLWLFYPHVEIALVVVKTPQDIDIVV